MWKLYAYSQCSTCRAAIRFLTDRQVGFETIPIRETPPDITELRRALEDVGNVARKLFNTSGLEYRSRNMSERLKQLSDQESLAYLASCGSLVKRPFLVTPTRVLVGFNEADWDKFVKTQRRK